MDALNEFVLAGGDTLWTWIVLPVVAVLGVYFTVRSGVVQFRLIPEMFRTLTDKTPRDASGLSLIHISEPTRQKLSRMPSSA